MSEFYLNKAITKKTISKAKTEEDYILGYLSNCFKIFIVIKGLLVINDISLK